MKSLSFNSGVVSVGDIFVSVWGYEQTNVSFYQVIETKGKKTVVVRRIKSEIEYASRIVDNEEVFYNDRGYKKPLFNDFMDGLEIKKQVKEFMGYLYISLDHREDAKKTDPDKKYRFTAYA